MSGAEYGECTECPQGTHGMINDAGRCVCCAQDMFPATIRDDAGRLYNYAGRDEANPAHGMYGGLSGYSFNYKTARDLIRHV